MEPNEIAAIGYAASMLAFTVLLVLLLGRWKSSQKSQQLAMAAGASMLWACVLTLRALGYLESNFTIAAAEMARGIFWVVALFMLLRTLDESRQAEHYALRYGAPIFVVALALFVFYTNRNFASLPVSLIASSGILLSIAVLVVVEQIYRNLPSDSTSGLIYVCVAMLLTGLYDIVFFLQAIHLKAVSPDPWTARGFVNVIAMLPLAFAIRRSVSESGSPDIPQQIVFYTFSLLAAGTGVILWLMADYYLGRYGGSWGNVASIVLGLAAICILLVLLASATIRARVRVFLTKSFFQYKYDYRKEWLRFIATLSESGLEHVPTTSVRAVAPIVNSPGGIVWIREHEGDGYLPVGAWRCQLPVGKAVSRNSSLIRFLRERQWLIDLNEFYAYPSRYVDLELEPWMEERDDFWLIVPLLVGRRLFGFIVLLKPRFVPTLNFEDRDLLRMVGRHVGTHIKQAESDKRLAESSQFGTYHRLSAFLMHDLNNLIAQQSLVVKNAEKFRHDPKFVDDTIDTIAHSVSRMRKLMEQLSSVSKTTASTRIDIHEVLTRAIQRSEPREPRPTLDADGESILVEADPERLTVILEHLIRNAQDATDRDGSITITTAQADGAANIVIRDSGCGMSPEFISERLFRPFDSTKGSQSMGIGAYQAREYVRMLSGQLEVESATGQGTTFSIRLPLSEPTVERAQ
jgi:putative PEP-CTERM system histidine kinase